MTALLREFSEPAYRTLHEYVDPFLLRLKNLSETPAGAGAIYQLLFNIREEVLLDFPDMKLDKYVLQAEGYTNRPGLLLPSAIALIVRQTLIQEVRLIPYKEYM